MKKFITLLVILFSSIFLIDNVSALSYTEDIGKSKYYIVHKWVEGSTYLGNNCYYIGWFDKDEDIIIENYDISSSYNITYYKICDYNNLIQFLNTGDTSLVDATTTNKNNMSLNIDSSHMIYSNFDLYMDNKLYFAKNEFTGTLYNDYIQFLGGYNWTWKKYYGVYFHLGKGKIYLYGSDVWGSPKETMNIDEYPYWIGWETEYGEVCFSSKPFYYDTYYGNYRTGDTFYCGQVNLGKGKYTSYNYNTDGNNYKFFTNYDIYDENGSLYNKATVDMGITPTINITKTNETSVTILGEQYITDVTLNIKFSNIDNEKYLYMYKYGIEKEWSTMTLTQSNSFSKTYSENNTLYVQVLNKDTQEIVTTSTYTISSINYDLTPYITIEEITEESCIMGNYILCQSLQINSHIADFNRYKFIVIDHTQNITEEFKEMTIYKTYYMNSNIEVRIIDKTTGEYVSQKSFTIATIDEETDNLGQYITQECYFASIGNNYLCNYYFYNYNPDDFQYYYGTSTSNFEELKLYNIGASTFDKTIYKLKDGLGKLKEISYSENTTVYFKIVDKVTSEIIYTKTFTISYDEKLEASGKKDIFDIFKNFNNDNSAIKTLIDNIWNSLKTSSIYEYIMILIVGALIVVILKASNR